MQHSENYTYDVALSFSGVDRDKARALAEALRKRNLTVYYDEWYEAQNVGKDLIFELEEIYLNQARLCVPLISQSYIQGSYSRYELRAILEREVLGSAGSLFPVRIDKTKAPGLSSTIAYVEYAKKGAEGIAALIAERLQKPFLLPSKQVEEVGLCEASLEPRHILPYYHRSLAAESFEISVPEIIDLAIHTDQHSSAKQRVRLAKELLIYLNWKHSLGLGTVYGAWREGNKVILSTLPNFNAPQRTLEFNLDLDRNILYLVNEWTTDDARYDKLNYYEWQPAIVGLTANRAVSDLDREVVILILEKKGAEFGFPIVPAGRKPEKLCTWLKQEPPSDYMEWGRDPRLVSGGVHGWELLQHQPTGVGILVLNVQGRWSASAFLAMQEALRILLPGRHIIRNLSHGVFRVCIYLSRTGSYQLFDIEQSESDYGFVFKTLKLATAVIARMVAASRDLPLLPPTSSSALPPLFSGLASIFKEAADDLGDAEYVEVVDQAKLGFREATWVKLRQSLDSKQIGVKSTILEFSFRDLATHRDIKQKLEFYENG